MIGNVEVFSEERFSQRESFGGIWLFHGKALGRNPNQQIRIGGKTGPNGALAGVSNTWKIRAAFEQVQDDLKMDMRRPSAIFERCAHASKLLALRDALPYFKLTDRVFAWMAMHSE